MKSLSIRSFVLSLYLFFLMFAGSVHRINAQAPLGFSQTLIAESLDPTAMAIADDGRIFVAEKHGAVRLVVNDVMLEDPVLVLPVDNYGERGLDGIALDPDFGTNQFFYVYYTVPGENHNRVSRFKVSGNYADPASETILLDLDPLSAEVHNGGALLFGNDGKLYISTGDGNNAHSSQQTYSVLGKVLRLNSDGTIPEDNPFYEDLTGKNRAIFAMGFRNPFTMAKNPLTGEIMVNDVGGASYEEINVLEAGRNYGWPIVEGQIESQTPPEYYKDPIYAYDHNEGCAVVGAAFYSASVPMFPTQYQGRYFFGDYCSGLIRVLDPETGNVIESFASNVFRPIGIAVASDGAVYYFSRGGINNATQEDNSASDNGSLWKVIYTGSFEPHIYRQPESHTAVVGESAVLNVGATGALPLSYQWFENGLEIPGATTDTLSVGPVSLANDGASYTCVITNNDGQTESAEAVLTVATGMRPECVIDIDDDLLYEAGDTLIIKGYAIDNEDGPLPVEALKWRIDFHHNTHTHPALGVVAGTDSLAFVVPSSGETSPNVWYRIYVTATDFAGLTKTVYKDVFPRKSSVTISTDPEGLQLFLDGQPISTPYTFQGVVNLSRLLYAQPVLKDRDNLYVFKKWSTGTHEGSLAIATPQSDSVFTALYSSLPLGDGTGLTARFFNQIDSMDVSPDFIRIDSTINFTWGIDSPQPSVIQTNHFGVKWSGFLQVPVDGEYTFSLVSDDGSRLWLDRELLVDNWDAQNGVEKTGSIFLSSGKYHRISVEYFDDDALASIKLYWSSDSIPKSIIPRNQFFTVNPDNKPPTITLVNPDSDSTFVANEQIVIRGSAIDDEDGPVSGNAISWNVVLHHADHVHPVITGLSGVDSVAFEATIDAHEDADILYRVFLSAVDIDGAIRVDSIDILPKLVNVALTSNIPGQPILWDAKVITTPDTVAAIVGTTHLITVSDSLLMGRNLVLFQEWATGESETKLQLSTPASDTTMTAIFQLIMGIHDPIDEVAVFPNPVRDLLIIKATNDGSLKYQLMDSSGKTLLRASAFHKEAVIDFRNWPSGAYLLKLVQSNRIQVVKIFKR